MRMIRYDIYSNSRLLKSPPVPSVGFCWPWSKSKYGSNVNQHDIGFWLPNAAFQLISRRDKNRDLKSI
ncbi:hypothetical protein BofuT4_uP154590.1 [Botrytis cinerea T4]|uniref:Uncharacterized protein n=1 Tax=Botryotinia fuckeliana (strain T4) TaxID=999810 RepID=G2YVJ9_BOTF4|nr:hypothetical protein BofuT4_uP154590.1 [Botrytis cinerea T4]